MIQSPIPTVPFTVVVPTAYGLMLLNRHDINQTNALFKTGQAVDHQEIVLLAQLIQALGPDPVFLDIGANFGVFTMGLARVVGNGKIHSFEPQRLLYNLLVGSVALNSFTNVYCHNVALSNRQGQVELPQFDYNREMNFGSVEFTAEQRESLHQQRGHDPARVEYVPLRTIDSYEFPKVSLFKIDAEGMELEILQGAQVTIRRCRPVLYVEVLKADQVAICRTVSEIDYTLYPVGLNVLCVPRELSHLVKIGPQLA